MRTDEDGKEKAYSAFRNEIHAFWTAIPDAGTTILERKIAFLKLEIGLPETSFAIRDTGTVIPKAEITITDGEFAKFLIKISAAALYFAVLKTRK